MMQILITGESSYIGSSFMQFMKAFGSEYEVNEISVRDDKWKSFDFSRYDVIFHVAGIVHIKEKRGMESLYQKVNVDLAFDIANKAKNEGVSQFIFMSTMAVYGEEGSLTKEIVIRKSTKPNPKSWYAQSKLNAELKINSIRDANFKVVVLRPPMVYGPNCPGNYARLEKIALKTPVFPYVSNKRSMIHINSLCSKIKELIDADKEGLFLPQDKEYVNTSLLVQSIGMKEGKKVHLSRMFGSILKKTCSNINLVKKVFGNLCYEREE